MEQNDWGGSQRERREQFHPAFDWQGKEFGFFVKKENFESNSEVNTISYDKIAGLHETKRFLIELYGRVGIKNKDEWMRKSEMYEALHGQPWFTRVCEPCKASSILSTNGKPGYASLISCWRLIFFERNCDLITLMSWIGCAIRESVALFWIKYSVLCVCVLPP